VPTSEEAGVGTVEPGEPELGVVMEQTTSRGTAVVGQVEKSAGGRAGSAGQLRACHGGGARAAPGGATGAAVAGGGGRLGPIMAGLCPPPSGVARDP
jgi:hypothetical protein